MSAKTFLPFGSAGIGFKTQALQDMIVDFNHQLAELQAEKLALSIALRNARPTAVQGVFDKILAVATTMRQLEDSRSQIVIQRSVLLGTT